MPLLRAPLATLLAILFCTSVAAQGVTTIPTVAPLDTESIGRTAATAVQAVILIVCPEQNSHGTAFLHTSGMVLTAEHVVHDCAAPLLILSTGATVKLSVVATQLEYDIAILRPERQIAATPLHIASGSDFKWGAPVETLGFPDGYTNSIPMLSVGYLAGVQAEQTETGKSVLRYVVNAAFNSGGPLLQIETGEVIGIVASKLAPLSQTSRLALKALRDQHNGFGYTATHPDGTIETFTEAQIVATVLDELRRQVQLVIGMAVTAPEIREFLVYSGIVP